MAKKKLRHASHHKKLHHTASRQARGNNDNYIVVVRGWMFVVAFALMLGIGALVGTFFNQLMNESTPVVAGASTQR